MRVDLQRGPGGKEGGGVADGFVGGHKESEVAIVKPSTKTNQTESVQAEGAGPQKGRGEGPSDRKWQI